MRKCMTANEIADLLADSNDPDIRRAVAMLRQQQAEIEALKERLEDTNSGWLNATKTACTAQAEIKSLKAEISSLKRKVNNEYIRAELALANKKLTDKEITEIYFDDPDILVFARAILRKAQEK